MRKQITAIVMASMLAVLVPLSTVGQDRYYGSRNRENTRRTSTRQVRRNYRENSRYDGYYDNKQPNVYDRHRKALNLTIGTGAGAVLGALIGGKKGAIIGAAAGLAGGAIVTAKQKPRNNRRY